MKIKKLTFVIPAKDEEATIHTLFRQIKTQVTALRKELEIIFIDDGSSDATWAKMTSLANAYDTEVRAIRMRTNVGKARALAVGFKAATGDVVFTMDADLQDDATEIPRFLEKLGEGHDIVSGYKQTRHDPWHKVLPSRIFNKMVSSLNEVKLHDHNCGFKCYRREVVKSLRLHGDMHRMIPCLASIEGYSSSEIVVKHHPRQHGVSKYGIKRFSHGFFDMITVYLIRKYKDSPMHFFGGVCGITASIGGVGIVTSIIIPSLVAPFAESIMAASFAMIATSPIMLAIGFTNELNISGKGGALESPVARDSGKIRLKKKGNIVKFPVPQKNASISENSTSNYTHNAVIRIDNSEDRECYISHLENAHYEPVVAKNWKDAVKLAKLYNAPIFADLERTKSSSKREMNIELRNAPDTTVIFCDDTNKSLYFGKSDPRLQYKNNLTPFPAGDFGAA